MDSEAERKAIVDWLRECEANHVDRAENGKRFKTESRHHAEACHHIAKAIELGEHHKQRD